ncbi:MAG: hypothetical protein R3E31_12055 [Chloroflexota bacterium]
MANYFASIILSVLGLVLDWNGFLVNTFSGVLGAVIGVWVSVDIVENYLAIKHSIEWEQIRINSLNEIKLQLLEACIEYLDIFPHTEPFLPLLHQKDTISKSVKDSVNTLRLSFSNLKNSSIEKETLLRLFQGVSSHLIQINKTKTFYILVPSFDKNLVSHLQQIETSSSEWKKLVHRNNQIGLSSDVLFDGANKVLLSIEEAINYLYEAELYQPQIN